MFFVNGELVNLTIFPDGTSQVWKLPMDNILKHIKCNIKWGFGSEADVIHLAQLVDLLREYYNDLSLEIIYLPYGRQDKEVSNSSTFALKSFAKILNSFEFSEVIIHDPHSNEALALIKNSVALYPISDVCAEMRNNDLIAYPDNGAFLKYFSIYGFPYVVGSKVREQSTGKITSYELVGEVKGKRVLIVDDICDGGATFCLLAKELYAKGALEVNLFVTHGIFSKGLSPLREANIRRVVVTTISSREAKNWLGSHTLIVMDYNYYAVKDVLNE